MWFFFFTNFLFYFAIFTNFFSELSQCYLNFHYKEIINNQRWLFKKNSWIIFFDSLWETTKSTVEILDDFGQGDFGWEIFLAITLIILEVAALVSWLLEEAKGVVVFEVFVWSNKCLSLETSRSSLAFNAEMASNAWMIWWLSHANLFFL